MTKIIHILSNLKHNGEDFKRGTVAHWEDETALETLVADKIVRVLDGAETIEEGVKLLEDEANAEIANAEVLAETKPNDTFAPTGTQNTWEAKDDEPKTNEPDENKPKEPEANAGDGNAQPGADGTKEPEEKGSFLGNLFGKKPEETTNGNVANTNSAQVENGDNL